MGEYEYDSITGKKKKSTWILNKQKLSKEEMDDYFIEEEDDTG